MYKLDWEKAEEPEIKFPASAGSWKKQESSRKASISALLTMLKPLTMCIIRNCEKPFKEMGIPNYLACLLRNLYGGKKQQSEPCMEQLIGSRLIKEYDRAVCCHPVCLNCMLSTSCEISGWMSYKLESRLVGETSTTWDMQIIPL